MHRHRLIAIFVGVFVLVLAVISMLAVLRPISSTRQNAGPLTAPVSPIEVTEPRHVQIPDATATPSIPPPTQHCMNTRQLNDYVQGNNGSGGVGEFSDTQGVSGQIVCQDNWLYAPLTGVRTDDVSRNRTPPTFIVLFYVDNTGQWSVESYGEEHKQTSDSDLCRKNLPAKIRASVCN